MAVSDAVACVSSSSSSSSNEASVGVYVVVCAMLQLAGAGVRGTLLQFWEKGTFSPPQDAFLSITGRRIQQPREGGIKLSTPQAL